MRRVGTGAHPAGRSARSKLTRASASRRYRGTTAAGSAGDSPCGRPCQCQRQQRCRWREAQSRAPRRPVRARRPAPRRSAAPRRRPRSAAGRRSAPARRRARPARTARPRGRASPPPGRPDARRARRRTPRPAGRPRTRAPGPGGRRRPHRRPGCPGWSPRRRRCRRAWANALAAATPTRNPVKSPGPTSTASRPTSPGQSSELGQNMLESRRQRLDVPAAARQNELGLHPVCPPHGHPHRLGGGLDGHGGRSAGAQCRPLSSSMARATSPARAPRRRARAPRARAGRARRRGRGWPATRRARSRPAPAQPGRPTPPRPRRPPRPVRPGPGR